MLAYAVVGDVASKNKQDEEQLNAHEVLRLHGTITHVLIAMNTCTEYLWLNFRATMYTHLSSTRFYSDPS